MSPEAERGHSNSLKQSISFPASMWTKCGWFRQRDSKTSVTFPTQIILTKGTNRTKCKYTKQKYIHPSHTSMYSIYKNIWSLHEIFKSRERKLLSVTYVSTFTPRLHAGLQSSYLQSYILFSLLICMQVTLHIDLNNISYLIYSLHII